MYIVHCVYSGKTDSSVVKSWLCLVQWNRSPRMATSCISSFSPLGSTNRQTWPNNWALVVSEVITVHSLYCYFQAWVTNCLSFHTWCPKKVRQEQTLFVNGFFYRMCSGMQFNPCGHVLLPLHVNVYTLAPSPFCHWWLFEAWMVGSMILFVYSHVVCVGKQFSWFPWTNEETWVDILQVCWWA